MYLHFLICTVLLNFALSEALFLWKEKPIFLCFKVCPLYCPKETGAKRRCDEESSTFISLEEDIPTFPPDFWVDDFFDHHSSYRYGHWVYKPITTTTAKPSTTTTEKPKEPTYICEVCKNYCGYPER